MNLETKIIIYKFTPQVFTLTLGKSHKFNDLWDFFYSIISALSDII